MRQDSQVLKLQGVWSLLLIWLSLVEATLTFPLVYRIDSDRSVVP